MIKDTNKDLQPQKSASWDTRSRFFGNSIQGVLLKNLPEVLNYHIHNWHIHCIFSFLENNPPARLLDIGCGYGRLSLPLLERFSALQLFGIDLSTHYVELYKKSLKHPALACSIQNLPSDLGVFDCILVVTVLMYIPKQDLEAAISGIIRHLKENGKLIIIEKHCSGNFFLNPLGLRNLIFRHSPANEEIETGGYCFRKADITPLIQNQGWHIERELRLPITTTLMIPIYILCKILPRRLSQAFLRGISAMDHLFQRMPFPSLHAAYLIKKAEVK